MLEQNTLRCNTGQPSLDREVEAERRYLQLKPIQWPEYSGLMRLGVPAPALIWPDLPARAPVFFRTGKPLFEFAADLPAEFDPDIVWAMVFLALDEDRYPVDLVAWATTPYRIASWFGATPFLGAESLFAPRLGEVGLNVFRTPLEWLKAERDGVVIVDPAEAKWWLVGEQLLVSDGVFGRDIHDKLRLPEPRIAIMEPVP
jgi:hypothetical protein